MSKLRVEGLHKSFDGHPVLRNIHLSVAQGTLFALLGPSGSGKTTLLRVLCGFEQADGGTIQIDGVTVAENGRHLPVEARRIGYVAQEGALFPHLSVAENIAFGLPRSERRARREVDALLALVGLPAHYAQRAPQQLSGGQQQRVALARALAPKPSLVMLDEPFSSLDASLRIETREAVAHALAETGATAILVTHDQAEALSLGHEVAVLWRGELLQSTSPETLYRQPATQEVARFVGDAIFMAGHVSRNVATCRLGRAPLLATCADGPVQVMIRPEQISLTAPENAADGFNGVVTKVTFAGAHSVFAIEGLDDPSLRVRATVPGYSGFRQGDRVVVGMSGGVHVFPVKSGSPADVDGETATHLRVASRPIKEDPERTKLV